MILIKNAPLYIEYGAKSAELLAQTDYHVHYARALSEGHICHNELKEENLPIHEGVCHIINWQDACVDVQLTDFANFLRRYARRSFRELHPKKIMEIYDRICPLPKMGSEIIFAQLLHPWQFIKIVRQYHSKKRGWTPAAIMSRMVGLLEDREGYDEYIGGVV